ncbi:MAG: hypothetical protein DRO15_03050 [Thermoprotei archaeon]|nr:MAG: hypothetical protein DRO15_03050 [Thermoprotei archaeon]
MPRIKLQLLFGPLRSLIGRDEIIIEAGDFKEVIDKLVQSYGKVVERIFCAERKKGHPFHFLIINGRSYAIEEVLGMKFNNDITLQVWPALDGG